MRNIRSILLLAGTAAAIALTSCGGGTMGTGVTSMGRNTHSAGTLSFSVTLTIVDPRGRPCANADVSISSRIATVARRAGAAGTVTVPLEILSGEMLGLSVRCGPTSYRTSEYLSPAGAASISRTLRLLSNGSLEITEPE